jgi:hypothetical protein
MATHAVVVAVGLSQRLREADDRIVTDERRSGRAHWTRKEARSQTAVESVNNAHLAAKNPWLQRQFRASLRLGDLPFVVGRGPLHGKGCRRCSQTSSSMTPSRSDYRATTL